MERSNPNLAPQWQEARNLYRNMLVVEKAANVPGENAAKGYISPGALRQATISKQGLRNYARGNGDFADLARAGVQTMTPLPNSGTAQRIAARLMPNLLGGLLGGTYGNEQGGFAGAAAGAAGGMLAPAMIGRVMLSSAGRKYLSGQFGGAFVRNMNPAIPYLGLPAGLLGYPAASQFNSDRSR